MSIRKIVVRSLTALALTIAIATAPALGTGVAHAPHALGRIVVAVSAP